MSEPRKARKRWTGPEKWGIGFAAASLVVGIISAVGPFVR